MKLILLALLLPLAVYAEGGGLITEFGGGVKLPASSSYIALPACKSVMVVRPADSPRPPPQTYSCGGDNPIFVGWPLAWEFPNGVKLGWHHQSQWFDTRGELHVDCICSSWTFRWNRLRRNR